MMPKPVLNARLGAGIRGSLSASVRASLSASQSKLLTAAAAGQTHANPRGPAPTVSSTAITANASKGSPSVWQHWDGCLSRAPAPGRRRQASTGSETAVQHPEEAAVFSPTSSPEPSEEALRLEALIKQPLHTRYPPVPEEDSTVREPSEVSSSAAPSVASAGSSVSTSESQPRQHTASDVLAQFLVPAELAGWLIGPKGSTLDRLRRQCKAQIWLSGADGFFGTRQRCCFVQGDLERVVDGLRITLLHLLASSSPVVTAFFFTRAVEQMKVRLVVPAWLIGTIIGTDAGIVKQISKESGAMIRVLTQVPPHIKEQQKGSGSSYRLVHIAGSHVQVLQGIKGILARFLTNPRYKPVYAREKWPGKAVLL